MSHIHVINYVDIKFYLLKIFIILVVIDKRIHLNNPYNVLIMAIHANTS